MSKKIIDSDMKLRFSGCAGCGAKCCQSTIIYTSLFDIERVSSLFPVFFLIKDKHISLVYFFYYGDKEGTHCPYLKNDLCSVYDKRPYACKSYPFSTERKNIYYSTTCPHIVESDFGFFLNNTQNIIDEFITQDFLNSKERAIGVSEEFVKFCNKNDLLISYEKYYANKELYMDFKPSIQKNLYLIHPFKIAVLRLNKQKLFEGNKYFLKIIQRLIETQKNIEVLYNLQH